MSVESDYECEEIVSASVNVNDSEMSLTVDENENKSENENGTGGTFSILVQSMQYILTREN